MRSHNGFTIEMLAEEKMWTAVIARTVEEWVSGPLRSRREAEEYLFGDGEDFKDVCRSAGLNPQAFQTRLQRLKKIGVGPSQATPLKFLKRKKSLESAPQDLIFT